MHPSAARLPAHLPALRALRQRLLLVERVQVRRGEAEGRQDFVQFALEVGQVRLERAGRLLTPVGCGVRRDCQLVVMCVYSRACMYVCMKYVCGVGYGVCGVSVCAWISGGWMARAARSR